MYQYLRMCLFVGSLSKQRAIERVLAVDLSSIAKFDASSEQASKVVCELGSHFANFYNFTCTVLNRQIDYTVILFSYSILVSYSHWKWSFSLQLRGLAAHYCKAMDEVASSSGTSKAHNAAIDDLQSSLLELFGEAQVRRVKTSSEATSFFDLFSSMQWYVLTSAASVQFCWELIC